MQCHKYLSSRKLNAVIILLLYPKSSRCRFSRRIGLVVTLSVQQLLGKEVIPLGKIYGGNHILVGNQKTMPRRCRAVFCLSVWTLLVVDTCARFFFLDANANAHIMSKFYIIFILSTDEFTKRLQCIFARVEFKALTKHHMIGEVTVSLGQIDWYHLNYSTWIMQHLLLLRSSATCKAPTLLIA